MSWCSKQLLKKVHSPLNLFTRTKKKPLLFRQFRRKNDAHEIARDYFDVNYGKVFKNEWLAIRCAMLSRKKYCAVINNYADTKDYEHMLTDSGAYNFIGQLHTQAKLRCDHIKEEINNLNKLRNSSLSSDCSIQTSEEVNIDVSEKIEPLENELFICKQLSTTCRGVKAFVYPKEDFTELEEAIVNSLYLSFFLDASSVLPVLALNPQPSDHILDLCAAPGGKLNIMIQAVGNTGSIVGNDVLSSRVARIKSVLGQFFPSRSMVSHFVKLVCLNGTEWSTMETECYSKVLVDVPCTNDRKSMYPCDTDRDNIFSELRKRERAYLPELQSHLLMNGILACQPGGTIVYSTCTASNIQNQYVVQYTVQEALQRHNITCEVEDLAPLTSLLEDEFHFMKGIELGSLVLPRLDANFGPTYFCKLRRLN